MNLYERLDREASFPRVKFRIAHARKQRLHCGRAD